MKIIDSMNEAVGGSFVGRFFLLKERGTTFSTEVGGASATFLTMAYILAVNPRILADSGGPCVAEDGDIFSEEYEECLDKIKQQYVTATAIGSMVACLLMGLVANLPIALAPGMGMNAYFTYSVVGWRGGGKVSYQAAVTAVLIEGAIFLVLSLTGLRYRIIRLIPEPVRTATPAGIGAFLAHLGLQTAEGIGAVVGDIATAVTLGACPEDKQTKMVAYDANCKDKGICVFSDNYTCDVEGGIMTSGTTWLGILGMFVIAIALAYRSRLSFIYGIALVTIEYFKKVVDVTGLDMIVVPFTGELANVGLALVTMLYVDFLDTSGTLLGIVNSMGIIDEATGDFPGSTRAYVVDAVSTMFGSLFGLSPITSYIESGAGVEAGAKTGLTAVICSFYFFVAIFFAPILSSIPPWAIGGALILVGALMARSLAKLDFSRLSHAVSGFLTVMVMPLTYSIAYGLIAGIASFLVMEGAFRILSFVGLEVPGEEEDAVKPILGKSMVDMTENKAICDAMPELENKDADGDDPKAAVEELEDIIEGQAEEGAVDRNV